MEMQVHDFTALLEAVAREIAQALETAQKVLARLARWLVSELGEISPLDRLTQAAVGFERFPHVESW
jgi:hypothetical protein